MVDGNAGKGDSYRKVDQKKWDEGWESAFGKKKKNPKKVPQTQKKEKQNGKTS
tara:strand:+ start:3072 stop:3230 length:159 start_codon:yes stop_codon:yes gene_type:complete